MAVSHVNTQTDTESSGTSVTANRPTGSSAGDLLVAVFTSNSQNATPPSGWTELDDNTIEVFRNQIFYKVAGASEPATYTFTVGSSAPLVLSVSAFRGIDGGTPIDIAPEAEAVTGQGEPYTTPDVSGGTNGRLVFLRTCRVSGSTPASFTASGVTELADVGIFSGGSVSYSIGLYLDGSDYSGSGSKSGLAVTSSQGESHNIGVTFGIKSSGIPGDLALNLPVPTMSMQGSPENPGTLEATLPLPSFDGTIFNGEYDGALDATISIEVSFSAVSASAGSLGVDILPVVAMQGETRFFAENIIAVPRDERWIVVTQDGWYLGSRRDVRDFRFSILLPLLETEFGAGSSPLGQTVPAVATVNPPRVSSSHTTGTASGVSVSAEDAEVHYGNPAVAGFASTVGVSVFGASVVVSPLPSPISVSVQAEDPFDDGSGGSHAGHASATSTANDATVSISFATSTAAVMVEPTDDGGEASVPAGSASASASASDPWVELAGQSLGGAAVVTYPPTVDT